MALKLNSGVTKIPVERDNVYVGELVLNTSSASFRDKMYNWYEKCKIKDIEFREKIKTATDKYGKEINIDDAESVGAFTQIDIDISSYFRDAANDIFGAGSGDLIFGSDLLNAEVTLTMFEAVLDEVLPLVEKASVGKTKKYLTNG